MIRVRGNEMSRDAGEVYQRAIAASTDDGFAPGRLWAKIDAAFGLGSESAFDLLARDALIRRVGLVHAPITIDGAFFDLPDCYRERSGFPAWIMPVWRVPGFGGGEAECDDLIAFADEGPHAGKSWRLLDGCAAVGEPAVPGRSLLVFEGPKVWLEHWLAALRRTDPHYAVRALHAPETGPESFAMLVLNARRVNWRAQHFQDLEDIRFVDCAPLRGLVEAEMRALIPKLPRLRALKAKPEPERPHATLQPAKLALATSGGARADR